MIPGLPAWALPDHPGPPVRAAPVLELERAQELARVPPAPPLGSDWDWERFMGTALMPGVPVTLPGGRVAMPRAGGGVTVLGAPPKIDPPPGVAVIQGQPDGTLVVSPLPPGLGGDDAGQINAALLQCASDRTLPDGHTINGGTVRLAANSIFQVKSTISCPYVAPIRLDGAGPGSTVLAFSGTGDCVSMYNNYVPAGGAASITVWGGGVGGMTIDGTNAGAGSAGLHCGDMKYGSFTRLNIQYFQGAGSIGLWIDNRKFWTENCDFECFLLYNTTGCQIDVTGAGGTATAAHDNCRYRLRVAGPPLGNAVVITNGANIYHCELFIMGGIRSAVSGTQNYFLTVTGSSSVGPSIANNCKIIMFCESDGGNPVTPGMILTGAAANQISGSGHLSYQTGSGTPSSIAGVFQFNGTIHNDTALTTPFPVGAPPLGTPKTNTGPAALMCVSGGTVTAIKVNGVTTGQLAGSFYVAAGATYEIDGSVAPTVTWITAVPL